MTRKKVYLFSTDVIFLAVLSIFHSWLVEFTDIECSETGNLNSKFVSSCSFGAYFRNKQSPPWNCFVSSDEEALTHLVIVVIIIIYMYNLHFKKLSYYSYFLPSQKHFLVSFLIMI